MTSLTVPELRNIVRQEDPTLLLVMETNISGTRVEKLWDALGFYSSFGVNSDRFSGGIGLFWKNDVVVDLKNFGSKHIDVVVRNDRR
jgi:hypothetical protein